MSPLFDETSELLNQMIGIASLRHQVLSRNLANIDTPGYQPMDVSFSEELRLASEGVRSQPSVPVLSSVEGIKATMTAEPVSARRYDGNAVDIDREMAKLAENALWHNALIQFMSSRLNLVRSAIRGG